MKKNRKIVLAVILLVIIDQAIKLYINNYLMNKEINLVGDFIAFYPYLNEKYSWINSLMNLGISLVAHIIITIILVVFIIMAYDFINKKYSINAYITCLFTFILAGAICSLVDKVAWGGSLDYIWLKGFFIFDLKDVYISTFEVMVVIGIVLKFKTLKKVDDKILIHEFLAHIKEKCK